ncbi:MAG: cytochrome C oxidase subunit IV family protein [Firmicutes bacterium]|uniref:Cytochrome aa3-600 menaquinol oxidase subunit 4 n=1 Tax=Melghirimyces thermohalophilus TaxID=1236220 RepID=A0A1G6PNS1_9BACL|nr:cytochrome C oxidase subunit IV family protein [Melghirimyces thermohalophilus]MDA8352491.1 cytochrome C oxidase subunit IV family protein [Bacillota bacterium]SDC81284.1 cytochrome aa3-600 menaquinol oxidase subunit 4 [Melghirimyces thermohalophilus]
MNMMEKQGRTDGKPSRSFPWSYVIGYILSLLLTGAALQLALTAPWARWVVVTGILLLAVLQVLVQLFFFMHLSDKSGPSYIGVSMSYAFFFAIAVVAGSIWVMSFNSQVQ